MKIGFLTGLSFMAVIALGGSDPWDRDPVYLAKDALAPGHAIAPPPAPGSPADQLDIAQVAAMQKYRTAADCARAKSEVAWTLETFFGPKYGPLTESQVKKYNPVLENILYDTNFFVQEVKRNYKRPRPYEAHPEIHPCTARETTSAYPSGHAALSRVLAHVLAKLDPARSQAYFARADRIASDRVLAGVHHPSDIESGKKLGDEIFDLFQKSARYQSAIKTLR